MIFAKNFARNYEKKNNTWNIRRLIDESFGPSNQRPSILYLRLSDFNSVRQLFRLSMHCKSEECLNPSELDLGLLWA